jgi:hypothetical protein
VVVKSTPEPKTDNVYPIGKRRKSSLKVASTSSGVASLRDDLKRDSSIVKIIKQQSNGESEHFFAFGIT